MTKALVVILFLLVMYARLKECWSKRLSDEEELDSVFGDLGDEVFTNLPAVRKSVIPSVNDRKPEMHTAEERRTTRVLNPYAHFINPLFYRDFIATKDHKLDPPRNKITKKSIIRHTSDRDVKQYKSLTPKEVIALNDIHKLIAPESVHEVRTKKSRIGSIEFSKQKAIKFVKFLRNKPAKTATSLSKQSYSKLAKDEAPKTIHSSQLKGLTQPSVKSYFNTEQLDTRYIDVIPPSQYTGRPSKILVDADTPLESPSSDNVPLSIQEKLHWLFDARGQSTKFHKLKTLLNGRSFDGHSKKPLSFANSFTRQILPSDFSEAKKRTWTPLHVPKNAPIDYRDNPKTAYYLHKSNQYKNSSLLNELSKVTMQWTGYKAIDKIKKGASPPQWLAILKNAIQPKKPVKQAKVQFKSHKVSKSPQMKPTPLPKIIDAVSETNILFDKRKNLAKLTPIMRTYFKANPAYGFSQKRKIKGKSKDKNKGKDGKDEEEPKQKVFNIYVHRPPQKYYYDPQYYQYQQPVQYQTQQTLYQQPQVTYPQQNQYQTVPPVNLLNQYQTFTPNPGVIPYNYFHAEAMADGRVRPALYPIAKHIPYGQCLPESSLCDRGEHGQCCGATTFCVDFWGINKCLSFQKNSMQDLHDPFQIRNNVNYKSYYKFLEQRAFKD